MKKIPDIVFLCGFSGSGKTETGRHLAALLGYEFVDTDESVETVLGKAVADIFADAGEHFFRQFEAEAIRAAASAVRRVIALGGGALTDSANLRYAQGCGCLIYLTVTPETAWRRLQNSSRRPMLQTERQSSDRDDEGTLVRIRSLMTQREAQYRQADITIDTEGKSCADVAAEISRILNENG
jgi:shikimate kinase